MVTDTSLEIPTRQSLKCPVHYRESSVLKSNLLNTRIRAFLQVSLKLHSEHMIKSLILLNQNIKSSFPVPFLS